MINRNSLLTFELTLGISQLLTRTENRSALIFLKVMCAGNYRSTWPPILQLRGKCPSICNVLLTSIVTKYWVASDVFTDTLDMHV